MDPDPRKEIGSGSGSRSGSGAGIEVDLDPDPAKCSGSGWIRIRNAAHYTFSQAEEEIAKIDEGIKVLRRILTEAQEVGKI